MTTLTQIGSTPVYAEPLDTGEPAFLLFVLGADTASPPAQMETAQAWLRAGYQGWFVILPCAPRISLQELAQALLRCPYFPAPRHTSLAWTCLDGQSVLPPLKLCVQGEGDSASISGPAAITIGRYGIVLPEGTPVQARINAADIEALQLTYVAAAGWPAPNGVGCELPFQGPARFCLRALGLIGDTSDALATGQDVSLRYFVPTPGGGMRSIRYGLLDEAAEGDGVHLLADGTFDPLTNWWAPGCGWPSRTAFRISGQMYRLANDGGTWSINPVAQSSLRSSYRTITGAALYLRPLDAAFVPQPLPTEPGGWYLTPSGTFALETETSEGTAKLLCGLAATEFVAFTSGDIITFTPGSPACATTFPLTPSNAGAARKTAPPLSSEAVTAWANIAAAGAAPPAFHAQPQSAATYAVTAAQQALSRPGVVPLYSPLVAQLAPATPFPLAPNAAASDATFNYAQFEQQILAPVRMQRILPPGGLLPDAAPASETAEWAETAGATTPQGFLVTVAGTKWTNLLLAANTGSDGTATLGIAEVQPELRAALQSRSLFLVGTLAEPFTSLAPDISIADWPFQVNLGGGGQGSYRNVVLFKFCPGTLLDLAANTGGWTGAGVFNTDPADISQWLGSYFAMAQANAVDNARYQNFADILMQEAWTGILVLRVDVPLASLPDDLRGLAAGIDSSQFAAHHIGITSTPVQQNPDGSFQMPASSALFGLIDYVDQDTADSTSRRSKIRAATATAATAGQGDPGYAFRVLTLFAEFANSQIVGFDSKIVLTMTQFFGDAAQLQGDQDIGGQKNAIELFGSLERRIAADGTSVTVYVFETGSDARYLLPDSAIFNYVDVGKADFNTLKPQSAGDTRVRSQFRMCGLFNFRITGGVDLFSFGDPASVPAPDATPIGLAYANLIVRMDFDSTNPVSNLTFTFDPTIVSFDIGSSSTPRSPSLVSGLPLSLSTIITGANGAPSDCGLLPVLANDLTDVAPLKTQSWYGLTMLLSLGTPGALSDISTFNATLVAAWSPGYGGIPGQPQPMIALLIQLPGTAPGKTELALQQVLKLSIEQIVLSKQTADALMLTFTNIGLKFLGQKMPSGAVIDISLAGGGEGAGASLGWSGMYSTTPSSVEGAP